MDLKGGPVHNTDDKKVQQWQEAEVLRRFRIIAPLLQDGRGDVEKVHLLKKLEEENNTTSRSIYRYEQMYQEDQFEGLHPSERQKHRTQALSEHYGQLLEDAIHLRKEVPERSVANIILILEMEGRVAPGILKRSTL